MHVFVAGGTGAAGVPTVRALLAAGHKVTVAATNRNRTVPPGASLIYCNALDRESVRHSIASYKPDAIINHVTRLTPRTPSSDFGKVLETNDSARGTSSTYFLEAAETYGVKRFVSQSVAFWYAPGTELADEEEPLWQNAPQPIGNSVRRLVTMERDALKGGAVVLRCGLLYGPNTLYGDNGDITKRIVAGAYPIVERGEGIVSFIHVEDVASACLRALDMPTGVYNVVDDAPCSYRQWIMHAVKTLEAPPPPQLTTSQAVNTLGEGLAGWIVGSRGATSAKLRATGWQTSRPSFAHDFFT